MNPLAFSGPDFLGFYIVLSGLVLVALRWYLNARETAPTSGLSVKDPYLIAYLRGGTGEAAGVAVLSLCDRGLLDLDDGQISRADPAAAIRLSHPLERAVLAACLGGVKARSLIGDDLVVGACGSFDAELQALGLIADEPTRSRRKLWAVAAAVVLLGIGGAKLAVAMSQGRPNTGFLVLLMALVGFLLFRMVGRHRTGVGDDALADLQQLFADLRDRAGRLQPGQTTSDAMLLAAIFGLSALPFDRFGAIRALFRNPTGSDASGGGCGSSSGCGGGGGGCGGCGS
jgi:uncharacterized protein (TIGR04222 family)